MFQFLDTHRVFSVMLWHSADQTSQQKCCCWDAERQLDGVVCRRTCDHSGTPLLTTQHNELWCCSLIYTAYNYVLDYSLEVICWLPQRSLKCNGMDRWMDGWMDGDSCLSEAEHGKLFEHVLFYTSSLSILEINRLSNNNSTKSSDYLLVLLYKLLSIEISIFLRLNG